MPPLSRPLVKTRRLRTACRPRSQSTRAALAFPRYFATSFIAVHDARTAVQAIELLPSSIGRAALPARSISPCPRGLGGRLTRIRRHRAPDLEIALAGVRDALPRADLFTQSAVTWHSGLCYHPVTGKPKARAYQAGPAVEAEAALPLSRGPGTPRTASTCPPPFADWSRRVRLKRDRAGGRPKRRCCGNSSPPRRYASTPVAEVDARCQFTGPLNRRPHFSQSARTSPCCWRVTVTDQPRSGDGRQAQGRRWLAAAGTAPACRPETIGGQCDPGPTRCAPPEYLYGDGGYRVTGSVCVRQFLLTR